MINAIWLSLILSAIGLGFFNGKASAVASSVTTSAMSAVTVALGLIGVMAFWMGLMRVAEEAGLVSLLARRLRPIMKRLFPEVPDDHPAMGAMVMNMTANMLGLGNAATPLGLKAMEYLQKLNPDKAVASNAMCTFLAINTSSLQIIPTTAIAILAANGATAPTSIIFPTILATTCSTIAGVTASLIFAKRRSMITKHSSHESHHDEQGSF